MYTTKAGKKFGSAYVGKKKDEMHGGMNAAHEAAETPEFEKGEQEGMKEGGEQPQQVVAQHGKAHTVHVAHDHKANKHKVVSTHEDGHVHESDHGSPQEAHDAGKQLAGAGEGAEEEQPAMGAEPEADGFQMPSLG